MSLSDIIRQVRFAGLGPSLNTLRYSLYRERFDQNYHNQITSLEDPYFPGIHQETISIPRGARFIFERMELEIVFFAADLARISWKPGLEPIPYAPSRQEWPEVEIVRTEKSSEQGHLESLASNEMRIVVHSEGRITYQDWNGRELRSEQAPEIQGQAWTQKASLPFQAHIYGLGERSTSLDHRQGSFQMWNRDPRGNYGPGTDPLYTSIPVYQVLTPETSHLVFYENSYPAQFSFSPIKSAASAEELSYLEATVHFEGGMLRSYFMPGSPARTIERYTELTGRSAMPPRWALGYHQSRWGYMNEADIREVVNGFKQHDLLLSAIHMDIDYLDGYRVFTVDKDRFPDLKKLAIELEEEQVKLVTIIDPGVKEDPEYPLYRDGLEKAVFCQIEDGKPLSGVAWPGKTVFPDFTDPDARAWWAEQYQFLIDDGIAGFWHDMNEPASFTAWGDMTLPLSTRHHLEGRGGNHHEAHNLYGLLMDRAGLEAIKAGRPAKRPWILSRSGWAGLQRYAWNWTADTESSWAGLRMTISTVLGLGLSGIPYSGPDIGGFSGNPTAELYLRWFQMAAFLPFFRTHSAVGTARREPWVFGEPYTTIIRKFLSLRYNLMPYFYTLAWEASQTGYPIARPLFWMDPQDEDLYEIEDSFLLGDALLVAPVLEPGATGRTIRLPAGKWYSFWDERQFEGPGYIRLGTSLDEIPVLVRAGSILPLEIDKKLILHIYPADQSEQQEEQNTLQLDLFNDSGDGPATGLGKHRIDHLQQSWEGDNLNLVWELPAENGEDHFPLPYQEIEVHLHGMQARWARIDGLDLPLQGNQISTRPFHQIRFGNW